MDYPDTAHPLGNAVEKGEVCCGIAICGSGNGICMTLNKHQGVRAALCWDPELGALAKRHNNANVLGLPGRFISVETAESIVKAYFEAEFEGGRHQRRIDKIPCK
jgi:sugar-phosphate isomerases, RpiB/LacA/LacB family